MLYCQQSTQFQIQRSKGQKGSVILYDLPHTCNAGHGISPASFCIEPMTSVWARQCFLSCFLPCISTLFPTVGLFYVLWIQLLVPHLSASHIIWWWCCGADDGKQLPGGQRRAQAFLQLLASGLWCGRWREAPVRCWEYRSCCYSNQGLGAKVAEGVEILPVWSSRN